MLLKFKNLSQKDKVYFIIVCICILILYIGFLMVPIGNIRKNEKDLNRLKASVPGIEKKLAEYKSIPDMEVKKRTSSLFSVVEKTAQEISISKSISYIKPFSAPRGLEGVEVKINNITGKEILEFVDRIQKQQIVITKMNLKDNDLDGLWTVRLYMEG